MGSLRCFILFAFRKNPLKLANKIILIIDEENETQRLNYLLNVFELVSG